MAWASTSVAAATVYPYLGLSLASVAPRPRYNYSRPSADYMFTLRAGRLPVPNPRGAVSPRGSY
jgi:hypothetical protein